MPKKYDFSGWATKNNIVCSDGRTIRENAFKSNNGKTVPLVWNHQHNDAYNILGHADLENRKEGVYAYCTFNNTEAGEIARELVHNGDVTALSIYANKLKQIGGDVIHGAIQEVSLVLGGANPEALIDTVISHDDTDGESAIMVFSDEEGISLYHSENLEQNYELKETEEMLRSDETDVICHADTKESSTEDTKSEQKDDRTIQDVIDTMNDEQKQVLYGLLGMVAEESDKKELSQSAIYEGDDVMKHNVFENDDNAQFNGVISHSQMEEILTDAKRGGLLSDAFLAHGIDDIEWLFPEHKSLNTPPEFIKRDTGWVSIVMNGVHKSPFSRIKSMFADLREDEARALGYMKGNLKKEEVFSLLKRTTDPQTVYKKQKMDRDDVIDIVDFDVISWIKGEMRIMLDEEIARAILVGDGRLSSSDDKIREDHIRPIWKDDALYNTKVFLDASVMGDEDKRARDFIRKAVKSRKNYKGSGNPTLYTTEDWLADLLLVEDNNGKRLYNSEQDLKSAMRVSNIVTVPVMEDVKDDSNNILAGIIVNLNDYNVGADQGGAVSMFEDFDIDYNQQKYLIETRCSGALIKPFSAITLLVPAGSGASVVENDEISG